MIDALDLPPPGQGVQSALLAHYAGVRERLRSAAAVRPVAAIAPPAAPSPLPVVPEPEGFVPVNLLAPPSWKVIVKLVSLRWAVREFDVVGPSRQEVVCAARGHAMALVMSHRQLSYPQVGQLFGGRDHSTVIHLVRKHEEREAGQRGAPFIWTALLVERAHEMLLDELTLPQVCERLGITRDDLQRCPGYSTTMLQRNRLRTRQRAAQRAHWAGAE